MQKIAHVQKRSRFLVLTHRLIVRKSTICFQNVQKITEKWCVYGPALYKKYASISTKRLSMTVQHVFRIDKKSIEIQENHKNIV